MSKRICWILVIMIISSTIICYSNYDGGIVNAEKLNIVEVIIDGIDDEPKSIHVVPLGRRLNYGTIVEVTGNIII